MLDSSAGLRYTSQRQQRHNIYMEIIMKKILQQWLGINVNTVEIENLFERMRDLESKVDDLKYDLENVEYKADELENRVDEVEEIDIETLKETKKELDRVVDEFEIMKDGYTVSVKLNPPLTY